VTAVILLEAEKRAPYLCLRKRYSPDVVIDITSTIQVIAKKMKKGEVINESGRLIGVKLP
jgi:hypothetical protein